jgi:putative acyl-CoA dehydrogenase
LGLRSSRRNIPIGVGQKNWTTAALVLTTEFIQPGPEIKNPYLTDWLLRDYLEFALPAEMNKEIGPGLERLGSRAAGDLLELSQTADRTPPTLVNFDSWGGRIDEIQVSPAWQAIERAAADEGIVATAYERKHGAHSRVHQFARLYLFHPSSSYFTCPLAMTDGAARALTLYGNDRLKTHALTRLISRDPKMFWTSGQWMTEKTGGSDVGTTSTIARRDGDSFKLYGEKWFTSSTTSQVVMTLARIDGAPAGSKGLSLFYLESRKADGALNHLRIHRLKDKLGTNALPTAEITLDGTKAYLVGDEGNGVRKIASLFNITRMYNACIAISSMRRAIDLARDYSTKRIVFGKRLIDQPLHLETLARLEIEQLAGFLMTFRMVALLGREETDTATPDDLAVLRLLTPIAKLFTAKQASSVTSEVLECFGGAGYIEDTGLPRLLRDAQVLSIWEGTTNVLSLDMLRAIDKDAALNPFLKDVSARLERVTGPDLKSSVQLVRHALNQAEEYLSLAAKEGPEFQTSGARQLAFYLGQIFCASLLLEFAQWSAKTKSDLRAQHAAIRWCKGLAGCALVAPDSAHRKATKELVFKT